ncbi:TonB-dependent receptor [Hellea balneolensis]|uniref:TonB-dependent receptor n=1 Tax=Hellea balneolensis TaxID=287478 RepID=UPI00041CDDDD|nr:TonB-dependent receptor [Hellea balneolensis]
MSYRFKAELALTASIIAVCTLPSNAIAQTAEDEIVVTAQFRDQTLQSVPTAVTAFTAETIEDAGIKTTEDFVGLTPNVTFDDSFTYLNSFVVIRGVTQVNNADSPVAIIIDGVPQNNQKQFKQSLFDIQQIEVLKGPQGSLYGRNAIGGAINIVTKQPTNELEGFVGGGISNGTGYRAEAGLSGPIVEDKILFRVGGSYYETDGLIENTFLNDDVDNVAHDYSIRGKLSIMPSDSVSIDLRASFNDFEAGSSYDTIVNNSANTGAVPLFRNGGPNDVFSPTSDYPGVTEGDVTDLSGKIDVDLPFAKATYILGYTDLVEDYKADLDFSNPTNPSGIFGGFNLGQAQDLDVELLSHELRFVSPDENAFRWIAGLYYLETDRSLQTRVIVDLDNSAAQFDNAALTLVNRTEDNDNEAWAAFGQVEFDLSDRATLQVGARYDEDKRNQVDPSTAGSNRSATFDSFQPKVTLSYDMTDDILGYATYSTGFRSGGFNAPGVILQDFEDETLTNYEIGLKSKFMEGRGTLNVAGFMSESEDFQFFFVDVTSGSQIISNLGEVDIVGFDADFAFDATDNFTLYGGLGVTDSEIKDIGNTNLETFLTNAGVNTANVIGSKSPKTTAFTLNIGAQFETPLTDNLTGVLRADFEHQGKKYWQIDNLDVRDPIDLLGLRASIRSETWTASLWAKNLFDEEYYADFNPSAFAGGGFDLGFQARPRTYGLDVKYNF